MSSRLSKTMSASLSEFHRSLARLLPQLDIGEGQSRFLLEEQDRRLEIVVQKLEPRVAGGLLRLPQIEVTFCFEGYDAGEEQAFLEDFDKVFQRGGG